MGIFFGLIGSISYRLIATRTAASYVALKNKVHLPKMRKTQPSSNENNHPRD
jgi:hypothetical protein